MWMGNYSYQFFLLFYCTIFQIADKTLDPADIKSWYSQTCYDNTYADLVLNDGNEPPGIYGYYDMFTWAGWFKLWMMANVLQVFEDFMAKTITAIAFIFYDTIQGPMMPWCKKGETTSFLIVFNQELCIFNPE